MRPAELAYQEAVRAISSQATTIDTVRSTTSTLLGAASIATAFLGSRGATGQGLAAWGIVATACFGLVGLLTVAILFPLARWRFTLDPTAVVETYRDQPAASEDELFEDAAYSLNQYRLQNAARINTLFWLFRAASAILVVGVLAWIAELAT